MKDESLFIIVSAASNYSWQPIGKVAKLLSRQGWIELVNGPYPDKYGDFHISWDYDWKYLVPLKSLSLFEKTCYGLE